MTTIIGGDERHKPFGVYFVVRFGVQAGVILTVVRCTATLLHSVN